MMFLLLIPCLLLSALRAKAEETALPEGKRPGVTLQVEMDLVSSYIWRGVYEAGPSLQPGLTLGIGNFTIAAWGSVDFTSSSYKEADLMLSYRLKNIMAPGKKHTGALLVGLTFLLLTLCAGHVALAYDAQPGAARIFDGRPPEDFSLRYVDVWNDDRGSGIDFGCTDEAALKDYLAALQLETYTEALDRYGECRSLQLLFDAPEGTLSVTLADNQSIHVTRLWLKNAPSESYYLAEPIDWQLLDRLIVPRPVLRVWFSLPGQDEDSCFFAGVYSMTQTLPDGTVQVLQEPDEGNYSAFGTTGGGRTVRLEFGQTLLEPYTVTCQTPDGSERRIFTQDELRGGRVPLLPGESADYTVAARLQGEDGSTYDAVFCFRYDRLAGGT